ncbi:MAG TPA: tRNA-dihydrouridine synthase [Aquabacterium sp.]|uniref:tRNA dihydrouridine synthase n=1 Tax=Aquabacterium sp. TaxID=1872578 RepID=UPI002E336493|nr:tRNA-dihydrouridine synthase [Aquabacterium sp.]HEX5355354.1 tRNA-dihydrouridine synthase [Aquabacterium sp.]
MAILLAPMEGLLDFALRDVLTRVGGIDRCVSEFIRVTDTLLPARAFLRVVPELRDGSRTPAGVPVRAQLLGSDPVCLADNAARLAELGSAGIDLNFGCPAKVVNRHGGGAALLQEPELLHRILTAVRQAVHDDVPVSAKMRLGFHDDDLAEDCARAIEAGGADELVVHARTKAHGYRPPAYWDRIADIRTSVRIPVVANGEIWTVDDARRCLEVSGCTDIMLGRGIVVDPGLALAILIDQGLPIAGQAQPDWPSLQPLLGYFWELILAHVEPRARTGRMKQWLNYMRKRHPEAQEAYMQIRTLTDSRLVDPIVRAWVGDAALPATQSAWTISED